MIPVDPSAFVSEAPASLSRDRRQRPVLTGEEHTLAEGRFIVHYTNDGADAPTGGDGDGDGVPDAAPRLLAAILGAEAAYLEEDWRVILPDDGDGGNDAIDVYLKQVDINGYAYPVAVDDGYSCYIEVDHTLASTPGLVLESVGTHELHHCVEFAYTVEADPWLYEATATFEQYRVVVDPLLDLAVGFLWKTRLDGAARPIDDRGDRFEYAGFVWLKFWTEYGNPDIDRARRLWESLANEPDWRTTLNTQAEAEFNLPFSHLFLSHSEYNAFACALDDGAHYAANPLPCALDTAVPRQMLSPGETAFTVVHEAAPYTAAYVEIPADGDLRPIQLTCEVADGAPLGLAVVAVDSTGRGSETARSYADHGGALSLRLARPLDPAGAIRAIFAATGDTATQTDCSFVRVEPIQSAAEPLAGGGCQTATPATWWYTFAALIWVRRRNR